MYAELGDFERSVHHGNKAIKLDESKRDEIEADIEKVEIFKKALSKGKLSSVVKKRSIKKPVNKTIVNKKPFKAKRKATGKAKRNPKKKTRA